MDFQQYECFMMGSIEKIVNEKSNSSDLNNLCEYSCTSKRFSLYNAYLPFNDPFIVVPYSFTNKSDDISLTLLFGFSIIWIQSLSFILHFY